MDWIKLHLALNHVPVIGIPLLALMLSIGWWRKSDDVTRLALWSLALLAVVAIAIKFTGDFAAEQSPGRFTSSKEYVSLHERAGDQATTGVFLLGVSAALSLFLSRRKQSNRHWTLLLVLTLGLLTTVLFIRSAHTGGRITHPELRLP